MTLTKRLLSTDAVLDRLYRFQKDHPGTELHAGGGRLTLDQYRRLFDLARRYLRRGWKILDWGCGHGHFSYALLQAGYAVDAFSLEEKSPFIGWLEDQYPGRFAFIQGPPDEPTRLPFPSSCYDAIFSVGVLEHVQERGGHPLDSLRELRRILNREGRLIVYHLPNRTSLIEMMARLLAHPFPHRFRFSPSEIPELCRQSGFSVLERKTYGIVPRNLWSQAPSRLHRSVATARLLNGLDRFLECQLPLICQNHLFVACPR